MTVTADTEADAGQLGVAERVRKIREAQDAGVSRAEGWRRRGPLLPDHKQPGSPPQNRASAFRRTEASICGAAPPANPLWKPESYFLSY